jgi:hypothetical protein
MSTPLLTFKDYLRILDEGAAEEADKIRADIAMLDATMASKNKPLLDRKMQLTRLLSIKEKQAQSEGSQNKTNDEMTKTSTSPPAPGTSGGGTPGTIDQR